MKWVNFHFGAYQFLRYPVEYNSIAELFNQQYILLLCIYLISDSDINVADSKPCVA